MVPVQALTGAAAISDGAGGFVIDQIEVRAPQHGEVRVALRAAGVCHTDHASLAWPGPLVLGQRADITLFVPRQLAVPGADVGDVPIVTLLHGVYGSHWAWTFKGGAHRTAARLIDAGVIPPLVIAMPSDGLRGDGSGYVRHTGPAHLASQPDFERWIVEDVPAAVRQVCAACTPASPQCIAGLSMGGFGALRIAGKHPGQYRAAAAHSAMTVISQFDGLVEEPRTAWSSASADTSVFDALRTASAPLPALRLDCGRDDFLIEANRRLHHELREAGIAHVYEEFAGGHNWPYWALHLEDTLRFFGAVLAPAGRTA